MELSDEVYGPQGSKNLKRHAVSFTKGLHGASAMRVKLHSIQDNRELGLEVSRYLDGLAQTATVA